MQPPHPESLGNLLRRPPCGVPGVAPERLRELCDAVERGADDLEARRLAQRLAHRMSGTAGTVGLIDIGLLGRAMEGYAAACDWSAPARARLLEAVALQDRLVREACATEIGGPGSPTVLRSEPLYVALLAEAAR
ncbi:MAG: Hpt domain-containing protein [Polyangiales bacterium]